MSNIPPPRRVLFDTNIYGLLIERRESETVVKGYESRKFIFYGFDLVREELRNISAEKRQGKSSLRRLVLEFYDGIVRQHHCPQTPAIERIANEYLQEYHGGISKQSLRSDFQIVACASIHGLDLVVSADNHTMLSKLARRAYEIVNQKNHLKTPSFHSLEEFQKLL